VSTWARARADRVARIRGRLRDTYGIPQRRPHGDAIAELVLTVLSQSTNDRNRDVAYLQLRERFDTWEAVRDAPVEEVEAAIRKGGISKVKSRRIKDILEAITERSGDLSLAFLEHASVAEGRAYLTALPGVGRKTAACVLLFTWDKRDVPVDTHVGRVATRLHLLRAGAPSEEQHDVMTSITPPGAELELHINMLRHGRRTCHSQRPRCAACSLRLMCPERQA
jgi:endonuclease-3